MDPHSFGKLDLDPDPHSPKNLDPDPHKVNANPKHWVPVSVMGLFRYFNDTYLADFSFRFSSGRLSFDSIKHRQYRKFYENKPGRYCVTLALVQDQGSEWQKVLIVKYDVPVCTGSGSDVLFFNFL
jgi:hypothetical protein